MDNFSCPGLHYDYLDLDSLINIQEPFSTTCDNQVRNPIVNPLPLYAPVPLPIHVPLLYSGFQFDVPCRSLQEQQLPHTEDMSTSVCEPQQSVDNPEHCMMGSLQPTFPTPSELLAELAAKDLPATSDNFSSDSRPESASKARRRVIAKNVGFIPTDPDTISSHEKKRHYLESLEQYILFLHQQFELIGATPAHLERVSSYRGLTSKSIRTLLVHMENTTRALNVRTRTEEQKFTKLRDDVMLLQSSGY
ncbi:hypothetical protein CPB84DRAFT_1759356 [Gymnopilus junonius]|uniref:Uncharacterized protein n=1 Tax=Gymnopilus junonius TaxID=109634 RepID=A0A9P5TUZ8_GYMJU|nr:hypothetical protein CPB84DRAFT_1759356 [Gymnopilus junonius]